MSCTYKFVNFFFTLIWTLAGIHTVVLAVKWELDNEYFDIDDIDELRNFVIIGLNYYTDDEDLANGIALGLGIGMIVFGLVGFIS